jgi:hypothetical protein
MIGVKVSIDGLARAAAKRSAYARFVTTQQVIKDSNRYVPFYEGTLMKSSLTASDPKRGIVRWDTPYARKMYNGLNYNFSKDMNPLAGPQWYKRAEGVHGKSWLKVAQGALNNGRY